MAPIEGISRRELLLAGVALTAAASRATAQTSPNIEDFFQEITADWVRHDPSLATRANYFAGDEQDQLTRQLTPRTLEWRRDRIKRARRALEIISQRTGGIAFFPKTLDEVNDISRQVAHDIRSQYTIGYKPTNPRSTGGFRAIRVEAKAKGHGKMLVRTKSGYYAGTQVSAAGASR